MKVGKLLEVLVLDYRDQVPYRAVWELSKRGFDARVYDVRGEKVLICRGSTERRDWLRNFKVVPKLWKKGATKWWHAGFLEEAEKAFEQLRRVRITPAVVAGHSRGGAVAAILGVSFGVPTLAVAAPRYLLRGQSDPRNADLILHLDGREDLITRVPAILFKRMKGPLLKLRTGGHKVERYLVAYHKAGLSVELG